MADLSGPPSGSRTRSLGNEKGNISQDKNEEDREEKAKIPAMTIFQAVKAK